MAQIINKYNRRYNIQAIQTGGSRVDEVLNDGVYAMISTTNSLTSDGSGIIDAYVIGNGEDVIGDLPLQYLDKELKIEAQQGEYYFNTTSDGEKITLDLDLIQNTTGEEDEDIEWSINNNIKTWVSGTTLYTGEAATLDKENLQVKITNGMFVSGDNITINARVGKYSDSLFIKYFDLRTLGKPLDEAQAGDVIMYLDDKFICLDRDFVKDTCESWNDNTNITDNIVGVVVINFMKKLLKVISIYNMSYSTPEIGARTPEDDEIDMWGADNTIIPDNYGTSSNCYGWENGDETVLSGTHFGSISLPTTLYKDWRFSANEFNPQISSIFTDSTSYSEDPDAKYFVSNSNTKIFSPYSENFIPKKRITLDAQGNLQITRVTSDHKLISEELIGGGKRNTGYMVTDATLSKWIKEEIDIDPNAYPAATSCQRYHTAGTKVGDWYLPSASDLVCLMARISEINNSIIAVSSNSSEAVNYLYKWSRASMMGQYTLSYNPLLSSTISSGYCLTLDILCGYFERFDIASQDSNPRVRAFLDIKI